MNEEKTFADIRRESFFGGSDSPGMSHREAGEEITETTLKSIIASLFPPAPKSLSEELPGFNAAVRDVAEAVQSGALAEEDGKVIIEMLCRKLTERSLDDVFMRINKQLSSISQIPGI